MALVERNVAPVEPAVSIPMTSPELFMSGPPESPGTTLALTPIMPVRRTAPPSSSPTTTESPSRVILPVADANRPVPPALPIAVTVAPTLSFEELVVTVLMFDAPTACRTATSSATS